MKMLTYFNRENILQKYEFSCWTHIFRFLLQQWLVSLTLYQMSKPCNHDIISAESAQLCSMKYQLVSIGNIKSSSQWNHMNVLASHITGLLTVCLTVYGGQHQKDCQNSILLAILGETTSHSSCGLWILLKNQVMQKYFHVMSSCL